MAKRPTISTVPQSTTNTVAINTNFRNIQDQFTNTLSLDGSTPNAMQADLDLNGNDIINASGIFVDGEDLVAALEGYAEAAEGAADRAEAIAAELTTQPLSAVTIITSDHQPNGSTQVTAFRTVLDQFEQFVAASPVTVTEVLVLGDVVHEASEDITGNAPLYGFPEYLTDWASRNLPELVPMAGNHDRDGTGDNDWEGNWSYQTYQKYMGPLFFSRIKGNTMWVFLGDMAGSTGGEQTEAALAWFEQTLKDSVGYNVFVCMHQPLYGAYHTSVAAYDADGFPADPSTMTNSYQRWSERLATAIEAYDNIGAVFFGHVGAANVDRMVSIVEQFGTVNINVAMNLEAPDRTENGGAISNVPYYYSVVNFNHNATTLPFYRMDAKTGLKVEGSDYTINLAYPINLKGVVFDGLRSVARNNAVIDRKLTVHEDLSADREETSPGVWETKAGVRELVSLKLSEAALDDAMVGHGPAVVFHIPGSTTTTDASGSNVNADPGSGVGGAVAAIRDRGTDGDLWGNIALFAGDPDLGDGLECLKKVLEGYGDEGTVDFTYGIHPKQLSSTDDLNTFGTDVDGPLFTFGEWGSDGVPSNVPSWATFATVLHTQSSLTSKQRLILRRASRGNIISQNFTSGAWRTAGVVEVVSLSPTVTVTDATYTVTDDIKFITVNRAGVVTVTLPSAAGENINREIFVSTLQGQRVVSASSNVVPTHTSTAGVEILPPFKGANCLLVSDGTNWVVRSASHPDGITARVAQANTITSHTGTTAETTIGTIVVPANAMGANGELRIKGRASFTNDASSKTFRIKINGTTIVTLTSIVTSQASLRFDVDLANRNSTSAQSATGTTATSGVSGGGQSTVANTAHTFDTTADMTITVTVELSDGTDTGSLDDFQVNVTRAA